MSFPDNIEKGVADMSYEIVISSTKRIETILTEMGAKGKGLHEKLSNVEHLLEVNTIKSIRFLASIRNKLLHDDNFELTAELLNSFKQEDDKVTRVLVNSNPSTSKKTEQNQHKAPAQDTTGKSTKNSSKLLSVLKKVLSYSGRLNRTEYIIYGIITPIFLLLLAVKLNDNSLIPIFVLLTMSIVLSSAIKRARDTKYNTLSLTLLSCITFLAFPFLLFSPSHEGNKSNSSIIGVVILIILILGILLAVAVPRLEQIRNQEISKTV